jgi:hypothetical protein
MTTFTVNLSPAGAGEGTDGGMDGSLLDGVSQQRTASMIMVTNGTARKMTGTVVDGGTFDDTISTNLATLFDFID